MVAVFVAPPLDLLADRTGGGEDELGGGRGGPALGFGQDAGVGVSGQDDAGVAELVLDGLEIGAGLMGEGRGAVAQVVQPDRWEVGEAAQPVEPVGEVVRVQWPAIRAGEDVTGVLPLPAGSLWTLTAFLWDRLTEFLWGTTSAGPGRGGIRELERPL